MEVELESLSPEEKKKEYIIREKPHLEDFWSWAEENVRGGLSAAITLLGLIIKE